jgi:(E)-4-hydroxy-3-methylbut-2-enyl-diphosphate synthase
LPGTFEDPQAPVYIDGEHSTTLRGDGLVDEFKEMLYDYVKRTYVPRIPAGAAREQ